MSNSAASQTSPAVPGLVTLVLTAFTGTMAMMAFVSVVGPVVRLLGLQEWHAGLSVTASGVFWMLAARRWGSLGDRIGRRKVLLVALAAYAAIYLAMAVFIDLALRFPPALWVSVAALVGTRALIGLFYAAVPPTAAAMVADAVPSSERASTIARLGSANAAGMVIGPAAAGWVAAFNLPLALYLAASLPLLSLLVAWRWLPRPVVAARPEGPARTLSWLDPRMRLPLGTVLVAMVVVSISQVAVGFFAIDRLKLTPAEGARVAGLALGAAGIGLVLAQALVMRLKRVPPMRWIWLGALLGGIGYASVTLAHSQPPLLLAHAVSAFGMGFIFPAFQALAADAVEPHERGVALGTVASVQGLGMVAGPMLGSVLYQMRPVAPYLLNAGLLACLAAAVFLRQRRGRT